MNKQTDFSGITACGECCDNCRNKEEVSCKGCIETDGFCAAWTESGRCKIHACARRHNVQFCGLCSEFPCNDLYEKIHWRKNVVEELKELADKYKNITSQTNYCYRSANLDDLEYLWNRNIAENNNKTQWTNWKKQFIEDNKNGRALTFVVFDNDIPVGEGTLLFSPDCTAVNGRRMLADNRRNANINALRIQKKYEGKGHISKLVKEMERFALENGYSYLTIGVEASETRNLAIYLHWGYTEFVMSEFDSGALVLYYRKRLK